MATIAGKHLIHTRSATYIWSYMEKPLGTAQQYNSGEVGLAAGREHLHANGIPQPDGGGPVGAVGTYRRKDGQLHTAPAREPFVPAQFRAGAANCHWHHGRAGLGGHHESAHAEGAKAGNPGEGSLREDDERLAVAHGLGHLARFLRAL